MKILLFRGRQLVDHPFQEMYINLLFHFEAAGASLILVINTGKVRSDQGYFYYHPTPFLVSV